ncbi:MAG: tRNA (uridine(34)/cytosine(34)/5-carboxymethylaminomethyluridine(34)-2'-O)-methyltransferase TrmL [Betaproteobacteria bacterium RIFCSPLOWO2_12_FULL_63_13]|nr:MAG: tRNA (uridine(34)/cytosine(34)/5-carboxymethylaminomethyluridine(34)-2'-O)-methyltransferase TrmL [Betaproteobacteria bacterium RIFCSPLOWO2_12_FULL_63_13]
MLDIVLYEPEIPPNTGNVIRLAANTGATLHLVKPLGFSLRDRQLQRAGLDYREMANVRLHENWQTCREFFAGCRMFAVSTRGNCRYDSVQYEGQDVLLFGSETRGLPEEVIAHISPERQICIPMQAGSRSLNLSNAVAVVLYEAWRQLGFPRLN